MINDILTILGLNEISSELYPLILTFSCVIVAQLISTLTGALLYLAGWRK